MNTKTFSALVFAGILSCAHVALAMDHSNQDNMNFLKENVFAEGTKAGATLKQIGKASDGSRCILTAKLSRYGLRMTLATGSNKRAEFRAALSGKVSTAYDTIVSDEGILEVEQVLVTMDERDIYKNRQHLKMSTLERLGEPGINNIPEITISNESIASAGDNSTASPKVEISCKFELKSTK